LKERPLLSQLTFENNIIKDVGGMCQLLSYLKNYDKLEGVNFRSNNFTDEVIQALSEGLKMKKELRVTPSLS